MPLRTQAYPVTVDARQDITVNSTLYTAGDAVGAAFTVLGVGRFQVWTGTLLTLELIEVASQQKPAMTLHFFDRAIATIANNAPFNLGASDAGNGLFSVPVASSDWVNVGTIGARAVLKGLGYWYKTLPPLCDLVAQWQTDGAPTWSVPNPALVTKLQFAPD